MLTLSVICSLFMSHSEHRQWHDESGPTSVGGGGDVYLSPGGVFRARREAAAESKGTAEQERAAVLTADARPTFCNFVTC